MANNTQVNNGTGDVIRDIDRSGVKTQVVGLDLGIGTGTEALMGGSNRMPVENRVSALTQTAGTITSAASVVTATTDIANAGTVTVVITGTYAGVNVAFEASLDGTNWFPILGQRVDSYVTETTSGVLTNTTRAWDVPLPGVTQFRVRATAWTSGTAAIVIGPAVNAFEVAPTVGLATGTNDVGGVTAGQRQQWYDQDVPGQTAVAYTASAQVGTLITFANAARVAGGSGFITSVLIENDSATMGATDIYFFNDTPTGSGNNVTWAPSDADMKKCLWIANMTYMSTPGPNRFGQLAGISVPYFCTATSLYAFVVTRVAATLVGTTDVRIRLAVTKD